MTHRDAIDVRAITEAETPDWIRALNTGFLRSPAVTETEIADRSSYIIPERTLAAFDAGRCVATFRSFPQELTTVGGTPSRRTRSRTSPSPPHTAAEASSLA